MEDLDMHRTITALLAVMLVSVSASCGKTLTRAVFTERLESRKFRVVTQENSAFTFNDLLGSILQSLEGVVDNEADKNTAGIRANSVPGIFSVTNNLQVVKP